VTFKLLQGAPGILGASLPEGGREMPVLVLLDPALGGSATLLQRALGPAFSVVVGAPPAGMAPPPGYVVVTKAANARLVAQVRQAFPGADLLVVAGGAAPEQDPGLAAAMLGAGADAVLGSMSVPELAARVWTHARRFATGGTDPSPEPGPEPRPRPGARPAGREQVLARLAGAKRRLAVAAVAAFTALAGTVAWAGERGSNTAGATTGGGDAGVTRQATPQEPDRFFDGGGGGYGFGGGGAGSQGGPAAGSSGAS
jgi:hypothetical protein